MGTHIKPTTYLTNQLKNGDLTAIVLYWDKKHKKLIADATDTDTGIKMQKMIGKEGAGWTSYSPNLDASLKELAYILDEYDADNEHKDTLELKPRP